MRLIKSKKTDENYKIIKIKRRMRGHARDRIPENERDDLKIVGKDRGLGTTSTGYKN